MKRILVTGATGFLGSRLIEKMANNEQWMIIATGRKLKAHNTIEAINIEYILGDLEDPQFVMNIMEEIDIVVHTAALSAQMGKYSDFHKANVQATENIIQAAKAKKIDKIVFVSSPSVYFQMKHQLNLKEDDILPKPINNYAKTKREGEKIIQSSGIPYIIIRPRALVGKGDTVIMPRIMKAHNEGKLRRMGDETNLVDITPVCNLADAIILSIKAKDKAVNQIYNISNGKPQLLWPLLDNLFEKLDLPPLKKKISMPLILIIARLMEWHAKWLNGHREPTLTIYGVGTLTMSFGLDITKAKELLGYTPKQSVEDALDEFVNWHKTLNQK